MVELPKSPSNHSAFDSMISYINTNVFAIIGRSVSFATVGQLVVSALDGMHLLHLAAHSTDPEKALNSSCSDESGKGRIGGQNLCYPAVSLRTPRITAFTRLIQRRYLVYDHLDWHSGCSLSWEWRGLLLRLDHTYDRVADLQGL
jgi:hypothetical protein